MNQIWKPVPGYEGIYEVSNLGGVRALDRYTPPGGRATNGRHYKARSLTPWTADSGHLKVRLYNRARGVVKTLSVHRLVLLAFVGEPPAGHECCHNDGNPANNTIHNLRWDTNSENQRDRIRHGATMKGEASPYAKLTEKDVRAIRADTRMLAAIAADYGVIVSTISHVKTRRNWSHI